MAEPPIQRHGAPAKKGQPLTKPIPKKNMVKFGFREYEIKWARAGGNVRADCKTNKGNYSFLKYNDESSLKFAPNVIDGTIPLVVDVPFFMAEGKLTIRVIERAMVNHYLTIIKNAKKGQDNAK